VSNGEEACEETGGGPDSRRQRGLAKAAEVYGFEFHDGPGDWWAMTVDHLFATVWDRDGLSLRDRRLLLLGLLIGNGLDDVAELQAEAALRVGDLSADDLREIVIFLTHYAGWPRGAKLNNAVEGLISKHQSA
jgi:4-carboxymuconolactone decarboxylase